MIKFYEWLASPVSPIIYVVLVISMFIGITFGTGFVVNTNESILYLTGTLFNGTSWGWLLFAAAAGTFIGLITKNKSLTKLSDMICFLLWAFAAISLLIASHWYVFVTVGLLHISFHMWLYLVVSIDEVRRIPEDRVEKVREL